mgnify:FL=1
MASIRPEEFQMLLEENGGDEAAARAMLAQRGYTVEGEEDEDEVDLGVMPGLPANAAALSGMFDKQRGSIGTLYDTITSNIEKRYRAPDLNDMLVQIGMGMMSPPGEDGDGGFGGAVQRGLQGIGTYAQNRRSYETDMNKMLSEVDLSRANALAAIEGKYPAAYASLMKPKTPSSSSPVIATPGEPLRTRATGSFLKEPPQDAIYELQEYLSNPSNTPQDKVIARRSFDSRFGYGATDIFGGQQ